MSIQATELLRLFTKASNLGLYAVVKEDKDGDYVVRIFEMYSPRDFDDYLIINQKGESICDKGAYSFYSMMEHLDLKLEEQKQKRIKAEKRKELIARLTPEERELLDLK